MDENKVVSDCKLEVKTYVKQLKWTDENCGMHLYSVKPFESHLLLQLQSR